MMVELLYDGVPVFDLRYVLIWMCVSLCNNRVIGNMDNKEIYNAIDKTLTILENNYRYAYGKKISFEEVFEMMKDLYVLFCNYEDKVKECGVLAIRRYIPILDLLVVVDNNPNHLEEYNKQLIRYCLILSDSFKNIFLSVNILHFSKKIFNSEELCLNNCDTVDIALNFNS